MIFDKTALKGIFIVYLESNSNDRNLFSKAFCVKEFIAIGPSKESIQLNH